MQLKFRLHEHNIELVFHNQPSEMSLSGKRNQTSLTERYMTFNTLRFVFLLRLQSTIRVIEYKANFAPLKLIIKHMAIEFSI